MNLVISVIYCLYLFPSVRFGEFALDMFEINQIIILMLQEKCIILHFFTVHINCKNRVVDHRLLGCSGGRDEKQVVVNKGLKPLNRGLKPPNRGLKPLNRGLKPPNRGLKPLNRGLKPTK